MEGQLLQVERDFVSKNYLNEELAKLKKKNKGEINP